MTRPLTGDDYLRSIGVKPPLKPKPRHSTRGLTGDAYIAALAGDDDDKEQSPVAGLTAIEITRGVKL